MGKDKKNETNFSESIVRHRLIKAIVATITLLFFSSLALPYYNKILSVRIWPSREYTRITIESIEPLDYKSFKLKDPDRLVLDINNIIIDSGLKKNIEDIKCNNSYIKQIRMAKKKLNSLRIVFDLENPIESQIFSLDPISGYKYRTVIDLYPKLVEDPIMGIIYRQKEYINKELDKVVNNIIEKSNNYKSDNRKVIIIDPGHGGEDPGAIGVNGLMEKHVTLLIAKKLESLLANEKNFFTYITRDSDYFVPLNIRVKKARLLKADLFISIHTNAWIKNDLYGASVFALSNNGSSSIQAKWLAEKENKSDLIGGVNLYGHDNDMAKILLDLSTNMQIKKSMKVGSILLKELGKIGKLHKENVERADFRVLQIPDVPSVLVETAFISNPEEELLLKSNNYQNLIAKAIYKTIVEYFNINLE